MILYIKGWLTFRVREIHKEETKLEFKNFIVILAIFTFWSSNKFFDNIDDVPNLS